MRQQKIKALIAGRNVEILLPKAYDESQAAYPTVYLLDGDALFPFLDQLSIEQTSFDFILVGIPASDRISEYTPWPAKALNKRFLDFGGGGSEHLVFLQNQIMPRIQEMFHCDSNPESNAIMGYSLGGLLSVYSLFVTEKFGHISSISGSFWYNGWTQFIEKTYLVNPSADIYISSGRNEGGRAQDIKKNAARATEQTFRFLENALPSNNVYLEWNSYGHHDNIGFKFEAALSYLNQRINRN